MVENVKTATLPREQVASQINPRMQTSWKKQD
jgi:hypothetical protein